MISDTIYQIIFDELSQYLLPDWEKLIVYLEYGHNSYSISFYEKTSRSFIKCYELPNISEEMLFSSFAFIDEIVSKERRKEKGEVWTNMTMTVLKTGKMHADFDYTDLSDCAYEFKKNWKKKYLQ